MAISSSSSSETTEPEYYWRAHRHMMLTNQADSSKREIMVTEDTPDSSEESDDYPYTLKKHYHKVVINVIEPTYGDKLFWLWEFNNDDKCCLKIINLPRFSGNIADLQLIAASKYTGPLELLPLPIMSFVKSVRAIKQLIFGSNVMFTNTRVFKTHDDNRLYAFITRQLNKMNKTWSCRPTYVQSYFLYNYVVSLNGALCGTMYGPVQITRSFVRWIHLRFGLFSPLRIRNLTQKWFARGFKVYRFTPIPEVTVLRIYLCAAAYRRCVMIHVVRQPNDS